MSGDRSPFPSPDALRAITERAVDFAWRAGRRTLAHFQTGVEVEAKGDGTPVTRADREAESVLRDAIRAEFPDDAIVGEEEDDREGTSGRTWILDPIDGTKAFVHGVPLYAVLVAVAFDESFDWSAESPAGGPVDGKPRPAVGVVHLPALDETVAAWRGGGCWWNGRRARVSTTSRLADALVLTSDLPGLETDDASTPLLRAARLRRTWGDAYGYTLVATGRADVMIDPVVAPWDIAAVQPLVEEAGGTFSDLAGVASPWSGSAIATNGRLHEQAVGLLRRGDESDHE